MTVTDSIEPVVERVLAGEPLAAPDRAALAASRDLLTLGMAADTMRRRRHGNAVTFVRVAEIAASRAAAGEVEWEGTPGELRLTGVPESLEEAVAAVVAAEAAAGAVPVTGFSLADLQDRAGDALGEWLVALKQAGLAEVTDVAVDRGDAGRALRAAAEAGMPVGRLSVDRAFRDVAASLDAVATLLSEHAVAAFAPLPRQSSGLTPTTGYEDVHLVALARLLIPVTHIQVDWQRYGPKLAQVALTFGADDLDGVSSKDEVAEGRRRSPLEEIRRNITAASSEPVERGPLSVATR